MPGQVVTERAVDWAARLRALRVLTAAYALGFCVLRLPHLLALDGYHPARWRPVGVLAPFDTPPSPMAWRLALAVTVVAAVAAVFGRALGVAVPVLAAGMLVVATYRSSWGQLFHTEHLVVLHLLVLAVAAALGRWRPDPALVVQAMAVVTVATYVVSGIAKLRAGGGLDWLTADALRHQLAFDNIRKELYDSPSSPLARHLVPHAWLFPPLAVATLAVELGAPVALLGRRWGRAWAATAWLFHVGVAATMAIVFAYPLLGLAFAPLLPVERLGTLVPGRERHGTAVRQLSRDPRSR